jgi:TusA-related sulfurtransferase
MSVPLGRLFSVALAFLLLFGAASFSPPCAEVKAVKNIYVVGEGFCINSVSSLLRDEMAGLQKGALAAVIADAANESTVNAVLKLDGYTVVEKAPSDGNVRFVVEKK